MGHLLAKVNAGADFVVAEFVFDAESFITWRKAAEGAGVECPIIAALLPIQVRATHVTGFAQSLGWAASRWPLVACVHTQLLRSGVGTR